MMLASNFYPRPPRGGRPKQSPAAIGFKIFLSTPSARRATIFHEDADTALMISIHALREEGDLFSQQGFATPSARRATRALWRSPCSSRFLSTPSARRATRDALATAMIEDISIHALREEGDRRAEL